MNQQQRRIAEQLRAVDGRLCGVQDNATAVEQQLRDLLPGPLGPAICPTPPKNISYVIHLRDLWVSLERRQGAAGDPHL